MSDSLLKKLYFVFITFLLKTKHGESKITKLKIPKLQLEFRDFDFKGPQNPVNCGLDEISTPVLETFIKTRHSWCLIVERNDSIERLNVSHNHIRRSGGVAIFKALQVSVTLCNQCCIVLLGDFNYRTNKYKIHSPKLHQSVHYHLYLLL